MARTVSPLHTSRRSPPVQRHSSSSTPPSTTAAATTTPASTTTTTTTTATTNSNNNNNSNIDNNNDSVDTGTTATTTITAFAPNTANPPSLRTQALHRPAERPNVPIAPASSNTSSPIYSTTSSPPISPGISQYSGFSLGSMAPSRSDSRGAALTMELAPSSTPTGRISKAKKGKRVHACEFAGCGKIFTRAEHKRRHELNHNPDATYRCPQQGCGKSFHRLDLLQRHQERHDLEASTQPSSPGARRYPSQTAVLSEAPTAIPTTSLASPQMPRPTSRTAGGMSIMSLMNNQQHSYHPMADSTGYGMNPYMQLFSSGDGWDAIYVTDHSHSPQPRAFHPQHHSNMSSSSSVASFEHSNGSPMIPASMPHAPWTQAPPPNVLSANMFEAGGMSPYASSAAVNSQHIPLSNLDGNEWALIGRELQDVSGLLPSSSRNNVSKPLRWHCWELYWQCFHPTYPIVHRPSFLGGTQLPPPLLACVIVAIGSYYDSMEDAKQYSLVLLEIATKILRMRPGGTSKNAKTRIVDLQTIVLLEVLSTFCARQISAQMSAKFRTMFANLSQFNITQPLAVFKANKQAHSPAKLVDAHKFWIENETRSRILHACTVLDSQQTILFDQPPTIHRLKGATGSLKHINMPSDDDLWDASSAEQWAEIAENYEYIPLIRGKPVVPPGKVTNYSYFQQQVINAHTSGQLRCDPVKDASTTILDQTMAKSEFDFHAVWMCKHTPIRQLLMVTGESWVLGRKVERRADYDKARKELRKWLDGFPKTNKPLSDCVTAHWHALQLLKIIYIRRNKRTDASQIFGTTNMLHENWVVYLASLVCWVQGQRKPSEGVGVYNTPRIPETRDSVATASETLPTTNGVVHAETSTRASCVDDPSRAADEAEAYFIFTDVSSSSALQDLGPAILSRTQGLLESIRTLKIKKHMVGGLMNDAEQVLLKLVRGKRSILLSFDDHT